MTFHDLLQECFDVFQALKSRSCFQNDMKRSFVQGISFFVVLRKVISVIFHDFPGTTLRFHDFPGLVNEIVNFHDFPGSP